MRLHPRLTVVDSSLIRLLGIVFLVTASFAHARAEQLLIEVSGIFEKDSKIGESFGSYESNQPFSVQLLVDESQGHYLPAGTPFIDGQAVAEDSLILPASAVVSLKATLGNSQWTESNIRALPRSDLEYRPAVILMGDIDSNSVKIFCALVNDEIGMLSLTRLACLDSGCILDDGGFGRDFLSDSSGSISQLAVKVTMAEKSSPDK
jgi:hypothetical protein